MEVGEITYVEYSPEECSRIREEYNELKPKHKSALCQLEETADKVHDLIFDMYKGNWEKYRDLPIYKDWIGLYKEVNDLSWGDSERIESITEKRIEAWNKYPQINSDTFYANISKYLSSGFRQDLKEMEALQKRADSLLYRCVHLNKTS